MQQYIQKLKKQQFKLHKNELKKHSKLDDFETQYNSKEHSLESNGLKEISFRAHKKGRRESKWIFRYKRIPVNYLP